MAKLRWAGHLRWRSLCEKVSEEWFMLKVTFRSLFYNILTSWGTVLDTAMEPIFWFVDHFVRYLGPAFVVLVVALTTSVVVIFYVCLLPHKMASSLGWTIYHFVFGHWLLMNIIFNYFKAAFTSPGYPAPQIPEVVSVCKKCIGPKPQRAHHCSICDKCILKMDHHCPWLNNCVGHFNHRYFFLFCAYMWVGTIYVSLSAYPLFKDHFYGEDAQNIGWTGIFYPYYMAKRGITGNSLKLQKEHVGDGHSGRDTTGLYFHHFIIYEFMLCSAVTLALGVLLVWHAGLVMRAETSIEVHTNRAEKARQRKKGLTFKNPYDFGYRKNWIYFLGLTHGRTFWRHVLLPSSHKPDDDGLQWRTEWSPGNDQGILLL